MPQLRDPQRVLSRDRLILARRRLRLTLREAAIKADVSHQLLHRLETGQRSHTSRPIALGIADAYQMPVEELFVSDPAARDDGGLPALAEVS